MQSGDTLRDWTGAWVGEWFTDFRVVEGTPDPATFLPMECAVHERAVEVGCLHIDDRSIEVRFRANGTVRAWLQVGEQRVGMLAASGGGRLRVGGLDSGSRVHSRFFWQSLDEHIGVHPSTVLIEEPMAPLYITEVLADAVGDDSAGEFIEVWNAGMESLDLSGMRLSDDPNASGDRLPAGWALGAGERALLVGENFDAVQAGIPPATLLIRLDGPLASGGISNAGEALFLWAADGRLLSAAPPLPRTVPGRCAQRATPDGRDGRVGSFGYDERGSCTPGFPNQRP